MWRGSHGPLITAKCLEEKGATGQDTIMTIDWGGGGDTERGPEGVYEAVRKSGTGGPAG